MRPAICDGIVEYWLTYILNQWLIKTLRILIEKHLESWYTTIVSELQVQQKEAIIMTKTYICRMSYVSPVVRWTQALSSFKSTSDFGCAFLFAELSDLVCVQVLSTREGAFLFSAIDTYW